MIAGTLAACGKKEEAAIPPDSGQISDSGNKTEPDKTPADSETPAETNGTETNNSETNDAKIHYGENQITGQTFQVELSEYDGMVDFVPFAPSESQPDFHMQIFQNGEVLTDIAAYVPENLEGESFASLDAVSFYDVNYDGNTDIVLIETYGSESFAAVYYGYPADSDAENPYFFAQERLSEYLSSQATSLSVPEIRKFLSGGKKNGEFESYKEAYLAVSRLCQAQDGTDARYDLIYFNEDDTPELAAGVPGYHTSLYTYDAGTVYALMDRWPYGAMGNAGYEYAPRKNSMRNYNSDFAGAIVYTSYFSMSPQYSMDTVAQIETFNFDDANGNGVPDEDEMDSVGRYGVNYIDGREVSQEECDAYAAGEYEYIEVELELGGLEKALAE